MQVGVLETSTSELFSSPHSPPKLNACHAMDEKIATVSGFVRLFNRTPILLQDVLA